jgi:hypothetical protein
MHHDAAEPEAPPVNAHAPPERATPEWFHEGPFGTLGPHALLADPGRAAYTTTDLVAGVVAVVFLEFVLGWLLTTAIISAVWFWAVLVGALLIMVSAAGLVLRTRAKSSRERRKIARASLRVAREQASLGDHPEATDAELAWSQLVDRRCSRHDISELTAPHLARLETALGVDMPRIWIVAAEDDPLHLRRNTRAWRSSERGPVRFRCAITSQANSRADRRRNVFIVVLILLCAVGLFFLSAGVARWALIGAIAGLIFANQARRVRRGWLLTCTPTGAWLESERKHRGQPRRIEFPFQDAWLVAFRPLTPGFLTHQPARRWTWRLYLHRDAWPEDEWGALDHIEVEGLDPEYTPWALGLPAPAPHGAMATRRTPVGLPSPARPSGETA